MPCFTYTFWPAIGPLSANGKETKALYFLWRSLLFKGEDEEEFPQQFYNSKRGAEGGGGGE